MPWIESHSVLIRHRKLKEFARFLAVKPVIALGHIHCLWHTAIEQAEDGDLSQWSDELIADAAQWEGDPKEFLSASLRAKFIDDDRRIHDWLDYVGRYLISKYKTSGQDKLREIWAKYGKKYGKEFLSTSESPTLGVPPTLPTLPTLPNQPTEPDQRIADTAKEVLKAYPDYAPDGRRIEGKNLNSQSMVMAKIRKNPEFQWIEAAKLEQNNKYPTDFNKWLESQPDPVAFEFKTSAKKPEPKHDANYYAALEIEEGL